MNIDMKNSSDFKLLDRKVIESLINLKEKTIFFRGLTSWIGFIGINGKQGYYQPTSHKVTTLLKNIIGVDFNGVSKEDIEKIQNTQEYNNMGIYPDESSIKIINDIIVVNMINDINVKQNLEGNKLQLVVENTEDFEDITVAWYI